MKPLYLVLARVHFEAFLDGSKSFEIRRYGTRYNERTCAIGREVLLQLGYSRIRAAGRILWFAARDRGDVPEAAHQIYPDTERFAVFGIALLEGSGD